MAKSIVVIGGGISGLAAALKAKIYYPTNHVALLESSAQLGGWIQTKRYADGSVHDLGPHTVKIKSFNSFDWLLNELDIKHEIIKFKNVNFKRYIFTDGKLKEMDTHYAKLTYYSKIKFIKSYLSNFFKEETVDKSIRSSLGDKFTDYFMDPLYRGIYAVSTKDVDFISTFPIDVFPNFKEYLAEMNSELKNVKVIGFKNGMLTLVDKFQKRLEDLGVEICTNCSVENINYINNEFNIIARNKSINCDNVILSTPSFVTSKLIPDLKELSEIKWNTVAVVVIEYEGSGLIDNQGFGHLIPSKEIPHVLGVIYDSCILPQLDSKRSNGSTRVTVMLGGSWFSPYLDNMDNNDLYELALESIKTQLDIDSKIHPVLRSSVVINHNSIPVYAVGHKKMIKNNREKLQKLYNNKITICGNSFDGVGIIDCINSGFNAAEKINVSIMEKQQMRNYK